MQIYLLRNELTTYLWVLVYEGNFSVVEELVGDAEVTATALAMKEACQEEMYLTLNVHERGD